MKIWPRRRNLDILRSNLRSAYASKMNNAFMPNAVPPQVPGAIGSSGHRSVLKIILAVFAALIAALLGLIVLLIIGAETGLVEMIIGLICASLPVPIYIMLLLWIDRYESEPLW